MSFPEKKKGIMSCGQIPIILNEWNIHIWMAFFTFMNPQICVGMLDMYIYKIALVFSQKNKFIMTFAYT
jgi:hypothetical protein